MARVSFADVLLALGLAIAAGLFWKFRIIDPATQPFDVLANQDFFTQIYPMSLRAAAWLREGAIPLWNPFQYCGQPFMATGIYGVLYPFNFFYLILPTDIAIEATVLLHLIGAGCFMYAYARVIQLARVAAALAAVTFMLSGFITAQAAWFPAAIASAAWLPLALIAVEKIVEQRRFTWAILLGFATAMPVLTGWAQTWMYTMYVLGGYTACRLIVLLMRPLERPRFFSIVALLAAGVLLGVLLPAAQLLPTIELQLLGPRRPGGLTLRQAIALGPVVPRKFLQDAVDSLPGRSRLTYVGMLPLVLLPLALLAKRGLWRAVFLLALGVFSVCVALTVFTPVFELYRLLLPGAAWFRAPPRILFIYAFAAASLAGIGLNVVAGGATECRARHGWVAALVASAIGMGWLVLVQMPTLSRVYLFLGLGLLWGTVLLRGPVLRTVALSGLVALITWDLCWAMQNPFMHPYHDSRVFDREQATFEFIKRHQGLDRTYIHALFGTPDVMAKQGTLREIYSVTDYEPLSLSRYHKFFQLIEPERRHRPEILTFTGSLDADPGWAGFRLLDLMSVRYVVAPRGDGEYREALVRARLRPVFQQRNGGQIVYENPFAMPRAYVVHGVLPVRSEDEALRALRSPVFDARKTVVLEATAAAIPPGGPPAAGQMTAARFVSYQPDRVVLETDDPLAGYLVLTDTFYPGWKAYVDSMPTAMYPANHIVRAVPVAAGRHSVTFVYSPLSFKVGAALSWVGILCIVAYAGLRLSRRVRRGH